MTNQRWHQGRGPLLVLLIALATALLLGLSACGQATLPGASPAVGAPGKPLLAMAVATAQPDDAAGVPAPPQAQALAPAAARDMAARLFPGPYQPVEQEVYVTRQPLSDLESFFGRQIESRGYVTEVPWADITAENHGASWAQGDRQIRVIIVDHLAADRAASLNDTFHLAAPALQAGDTLVTVIGVDRGRPLK